MKKASKIILNISGALGIVSFLLLMVVALFFLVTGTGSIHKELVQAIMDGTIQTSFPGTVEEQAQAIEQLLLIYGVVIAACAAFCLPSAIVSFIAAGKGTKGWCIAVIVLAALSGTYLGVLGGIFGLIPEKKKVSLEK